MSTKNNIKARVTYEFKFPAEKVFDAWIKPEIARKWWSLLEFPDGSKPDIRRIEIDARVGGRYTFSDMRSIGEAIHWGTYKVIDRPNKLVFTWFTSEEEEIKGISTVTMIFTSTKNDCRVELTHEMDAKWAEYVKQIENSWTRMLEGIDKLQSIRQGRDD